MTCEQYEQLRSTLYQAEAKLWVIECELDHRERRAIQSINSVRATIYESLGWDITKNERGMMVAAKKRVTT